MSAPKTFRPAVVTNDTTHFSIKHHVRIGGTSICYCDEPFRAEMVKAALNSWRRSAAGKRWWRTLNRPMPKVAFHDHHP